MTIATAKGSFSAATFAALAAWQTEMQGSGATIEIGNYVVDVQYSDDTAEDYAALVFDEIDGAIHTLGAEATEAGDTEQANLCDAAMKGDIAALEACCAVFCNASAQD